MQLELYNFPSEIPEGALRGKAVVVIDVLRSSTTIVTAFANGCKDIIPTDTVEAATSLALKIGREAILLGGERDGKKIEGFDLGNSPAEYSYDKVNGKTIIFSSTNGSKAIKEASSRHSALGIIGALLNAGYVASLILQTNYDVVLMCSGRLNIFALEDVVCGGLIISNLLDTLKEAPEMNDAAMAAHILYLQYSSDLLGLLKSCNSGQLLTKMGFENDLIPCSAVDSFKEVPRLVEGRIVRK